MLICSPEVKSKEPEVLLYEINLIDEINNKDKLLKTNALIGIMEFVIGSETNTIVTIFINRVIKLTSSHRRNIKIEKAPMTIIRPNMYNDFKRVIFLKFSFLTTKQNKTPNTPRRIFGMALDK